MRRRRARRDHGDSARARTFVEEAGGEESPTESDSVPAVVRRHVLRRDEEVDGGAAEKDIVLQTAAQRAVADVDALAQLGGDGE